MVIASTLQSKTTNLIRTSNQEQGAGGGGGGFTKSI